MENSSKRQEGSSVTFRANLDVKPWEWLKISTILSYSVANTDIEGYWGTKTYHAALIRRSADEAGADETSGMPRGGELTVDKSRNKSYMFRLQADLNRYWGAEQQHNINASVGMETNPRNMMRTRILPGDMIRSAGNSLSWLIRRCTRPMRIGCQRMYRW